MRPSSIQLHRQSTAANFYREKPAIDIEPLLRFFEARGGGTWADFDSAAKETLTGLRDSFELANGLAVHGFLEFAWRDRSWQFGPTTLVEGREGDIPPGAATARQLGSRWHLFGASERVARQLCVLANVTASRTPIELDLPRNRMRARFFRHALPLESPAKIFESKMRPEIVLRSQVATMFDALPNVKAAATSFVDDSQSVEAATLRAAAQTEKFDSVQHRWMARHFDYTPGFWRIDSVVRMYFVASVERDYSFSDFHDARPQASLHIVRVPPELGRWFSAVDPGNVTILPAEQSFVVRLSDAVFDLPVVHERWLMLWGCRKQTVKEGNLVTIKFNHIDSTIAKKFASLLSLKER
jgi:hypothetical protein